jgi:hypothetical protein
MGRYLPRDYEPIPDDLLRPGADLIDVARRITRNQNWIWANQGAVLAAFAHEPMVSQMPTITGVGSVRAAYFAAPMRSRTGSSSVRVISGVTVSGDLTTMAGKVRLYQLLPGEVSPSADTPYDEIGVTSSTYGPLSFTARIRSGSDPLRFCLELIGAGTATYRLHTVTVLWEVAPTQVLGETVARWSAISQSYVAADRSVSAALLRALSNRTLGLLAETPAPLFSHCFLWSRYSSTGAGSNAFVPTWFVRTSALQPAPWVTIRPRILVTGRDASYHVTAAARVAGSSTYVASASGTVYTTAVDIGGGVYVAEGTDAIRLQLPAGQLLEIRVDVTAGGGSLSTDLTSSYPQFMGASLLGVTITQDAPTAAQLALPGAETVPATYQPLDDLAVAPGRSVVAQDDRLGRRAGLYYLARNLTWLAANRNGHTLVADWLHRTQVAGYTPGNAGDGVYRNVTVNTRNGGTYPGGSTEVGWADRAGPTNSNSITTGGQHRSGAALAKLACAPMNGGKVGAIVRAEILYQVDSPWEDNFTAEVTANAGSFPLFRGGVDAVSMKGGFRVIGPAGAKPGAGALMRMVGEVPFGKDRHAPGEMVALHSAYVYELPLTQADLDALD